MSSKATSRIVFLHIPKTAGQTVHMELERILGAEAVSPVRVHTQVPTDAEQYPDGFRLYSGHLDWPEPAVMPTPRFTFTVLRDPFERIASFYFFLLRQAEAATPEQLLGNPGMAMREILSTDAAGFFLGGSPQWQSWMRDHFDNLQANYLATGKIRGRRTIADMAHDDLVELALQRSQQIDRIYSTKTLHKLEEDLTPFLGTRPTLQSLRVNAAPMDENAKRWPELVKLLGPEASAQVEAFGVADSALIDRLGVAI